MLLHFVNLLQVLDLCLHAILCWVCWCRFFGSISCGDIWLLYQFLYCLLVHLTMLMILEFFIALALFLLYTLTSLFFQCCCRLFCFICCCLCANTVYADSWVLSCVGCWSPPTFILAVMLLILAMNLHSRSWHSSFLWPLSSTSLHALFLQSSNYVPAGIHVVLLLLQVLYGVVLFGLLCVLLLFGAPCGVVLFGLSWELCCCLDVLLLVSFLYFFIFLLCIFFCLPLRYRVSFYSSCIFVFFSFFGRGVRLFSLGLAT